MRSSTSDDHHLTPAYLEVTADGVWTGHLLDLPGCVAFGTSLPGTVEALRVNRVAYLDWLRSHGESATSPDEESPLAVAETIYDVSSARKSGEAVALFTPELNPVTDGMIDRTIQLLEYCHSDIEGLLRNASRRTFDHRLEPDSRSALEIVRHIGQAECWYLTRLEPEDDPEIAGLYQSVTTGDAVDGLRAVLNAAQDRFRGWSPEQRASKFVPQHNSRYGSESWTARKVLRRFVEHRREHLDELRRTVDNA